MKSIFTIATLLLMNFAFAQFPKKDPTLLKGYKIEVKALTESQLKYTSGYEHFFSDPDGMKIYMGNDKRRTKPDALGGRVFKVVDVTAEKPSYSMYVNYTLKLEGDGETVYYKYEQGNAVHVNPVNFTLPDDYYCSYVTEDRDSEGHKKFIAEEQFMYRAYKVYGLDSYGYAIELMTSIDSNETGKGVTIVLDNGKKIVRPNLQVEMDDSGRTSQFNVLFLLTDEEVNLLANNKVLSYTLYKHEQTMYKSFAPVLQGIFKCLLTKK